MLDPGDLRSVETLATECSPPGFIQLVDPRSNHQCMIAGASNHLRRRQYEYKYTVVTMAHILLLVSEGYLSVPTN